MKSKKYINSLLFAALRIFLLITLTISFNQLSAQQAETYEEAITLADKNYKQDNLLDAKAYYQMALKYKSDDEYAKERIADIVEKMKVYLSKEDAYYDIIDLADVLYDEMALDKAVEQYRKALQIIPGDEYAKEQIAKIERMQSEQKDRIASFDKAMSDGNSLLSENKFEEAISAFEEAQLIFPGKSSPIDNINLARSLMDEYNSNLVIFEEQTTLAERYLLVKNYATALEHYENAYNIFPNNDEVNARIAEIKPKADNQRKYNTQVEAADELYISKDFMGAMAKYQEAAKLWPENSYPHDMIGKIEDQLALQREDLDNNYTKSIHKADSLLALEEYTAAQGQYNLALILKPEESYPKTKLSEIDTHFEEQRKAFEANYSDMLVKADSLFNVQQYMSAKEQYEFALTIKPEDAYPQKRLLDIENELALIAEKERIDKDYQALIAEADKLFSAGHYDLAVNKYNEAQALKSLEDYPQQRVKEIQLLLANAAEQKELDENYGKQVLLAARLFNEDKLEESKQSYQNALDLKPYETLPKEQIVKIDSITVARIKQAEIDAAYQVHLKLGDSLLNLQAYDDAISAYKEALIVKPEGEEALTNLNKAKTIKINREKEIARQQTYDQSVRLGDELFDSKSYELAKVEFEKAANAKPSESYPQQKISEIDAILVRLAAERQQRYDEAILKADEYFTQDNHKDALIEYKIARSIKPEERYPQSKINDCEKNIEEQMKVIRVQYDVVIAEADNMYNSKIYDKAISKYQEARQMIPDEPYPVEMINKITKYLEDNAITDIIMESVVINSGITEKFTFNPIPVNVRKSNYVLVKARNLTDKSFKIIFSYGSDNGKNGGFVIQIPPNEQMNDFIIRVGNQYKWFSEDNNWLSIYPQNGDIEINVVRITTSN